jgi:hypothetical protein
MVSERSELVLTEGFRSYPTMKLRDTAYRPDAQSEFLLHFDSEPLRDAAGRFDVQGQDVQISEEHTRVGLGAVAFRNPSDTLSLTARDPRLFRPERSWGDFTLEFWLYPATVDDDQTILRWQGFRRSGNGVTPQEIRVSTEDRRLVWHLQNFFRPPGGGTFTLELEGRSGLVPRQWSHHLLRFDAATALVEYLMDGVPQAVTHANETRREGGGIYTPLIGESPSEDITVGDAFVGFLDELRLTERFVEKPHVSPRAESVGRLETETIDLGYVGSTLKQIDASFSAPGDSAVTFSYRFTDTTGELLQDEARWRQFEPNQPLTGEHTGRFLQLRVRLLPGTPEDAAPSVSRLLVRYEENAPPPPPVRVTATAGDGTVRLEWTEVPEADIVGYKVYYGQEPGQYFGTDSREGPSPIDVGNSTETTLHGLSNGRLYYFAVAAYDASGITPRTVLSSEVRARPLRNSE